MRPISTVILGLMGALLLFQVTPGRAQISGGAMVLILDPSIRASGMGHASGSVFWGPDCDHWANPALLGYERGIRFEHGRTQLVPNLAPHVYFTTDRLTIGDRGLGIFLTGFPLGRPGEDATRLWRKDGH